MQATKKKTLWQRIRRDHQLLILLIPGLLFYAIFRYGPMYGIVIAFKKYSPFLGVAKSPWVGLTNFRQFFQSPEFLRLFKNTFILGFWSMFFGFPAPILFALVLNEGASARSKSSIRPFPICRTFCLWSSSAPSSGSCSPSQTA